MSISLNITSKYTSVGLIFSSGGWGFKTSLWSSDLLHKKYFAKLSVSDTGGCEARAPVIPCVFTLFILLCGFHKCSFSSLAVNSSHVVRNPSTSC